MATRRKNARPEGDGNQPPRTLTISSEAEAFQYLQRALAKDLGDQPIKVEFKNWPILSIRLEGKGYNSTITPQMAEALVELQHALNRTYARTVRGSSNANVLTHEEKRSIQFKAKVEKGSSVFNVDIGQFAEKMAMELVGKMDGSDVVVTVVGTAIVGASLLAYKAFLAARSDDRKVDQATKERVALSEQETKRLEVVSRALASQPQLKAVQEDFDNVRQDIVKGISDASTIQVQGVELTNAEARSIAATPRAHAEDVQLNGNYKIVRLDWSRDDEVRISLFGTDGERREFIASMRAHNLTEANKEKLKVCEWERKPIHLSINATVLRGEVTTATIVGVEWPKNDKKG